MASLATLRMFDSIWPQNLARKYDDHARDQALVDMVVEEMVASLPTGADAYLGYVGGFWPTFAALLAKFPHSKILGMAINASEDAEGADCEKGDLSIAQMPGWTHRQLARGVWRPVQYASISNMGSLLAADTGAGIARSQVRLLSAHYGGGKHICGPSTCNLGPQCDGTQWTDTSAGVGGTLIDESELEPWFFTPPVPVPVPVHTLSGDPMFGWIPVGPTINAPVPAGAKAVRLFCDHVPAATPVKVRVAAHSAGQATFHQVETVTLTSLPLDVKFTGANVDGVSLQREDGTDLVPGFLVI
jgi:hypothetical protein